jgi:anti-sigma regulatory factor (Ser/Thr protein kinase)
MAGTQADPIPPLWLTVPARPGQLPGLRRALRQWLLQAGVDEHDSTSVLVAVGEATSNAVEHAYHDTEPGLVRLTAHLDPHGLLTLKVIDSGRWRTPAGHSAARGRGLALMRATMGEVEVRSDDDGTTVLMRLPLSGDPADHDG